MATESNIRDLANTKLRDHFERNRGNDYNKVRVLLLYWQKSDMPGCKTEADALDKLFTGKLQYHVQHWEIPPENSQLFLDRQISNFLTTLIEPHTLGIIHYGGHGDADEDSGNRERRSVWASHGDFHAAYGSTLSWSKIQHKLGDVDADVLLILDCCFAAQNMRNRDRVVPSNVELLAACAMRLGTPQPGTKQSFTMALIREIELALEEARPVIIKDIFSMLARQDAKLQQTPIYHPLRANKSIRLDRLGPYPGLPSKSNTSLASLALQIDFGTPVNDTVINEILSWLMLNAPREVSHVQIVNLVNRAKRLQRFVSGDPSQRSSHSPSISLAKVPDGSRQEILTAWSGFKDDVARSARAAADAPNPADPGGDLPQAEATSSSSMLGFLGSLKSMTSNLQSVITRNVLAIPELFDENVLKAEIQNTETDAFDVPEGTLEVRLAGCMTEAPDFKPLKQIFSDKTQVATASKILFRGTMSEIGDVLVEYKYIDVTNVYAGDVSRDKIKRLVMALKKAHDESFRTTECLGYLSDDLHGHYGIVFRGLSDPECRILSLQWILRQHFEKKKGVPKPSLGQRYQLALTVGQALLQWHLTGWVHQGIASPNIMLFEDEPGHPEYASPYLFGFEHTREHDASSARRTDMDTMSDLYRHPDRQGVSPRKLHTKYHDIYSFGLLLVEIGLWCPLDKCIKQSWEGADIQNGLSKQLRRGLLAHGMGLAFEQAASVCLSGDFSVDTDDKNETRLAAKFEAKVIQQLERGTRVDGDHVYSLF